VQHISSSSLVASLVLVVVAAAGCSTPSPSRPVTPDDKIDAAIAEVGFGATQQLFRGNCDDRTCVLVADAKDPRRIALIVLGPGDVASSAGRVGAEPATMDEMGTDGREFIYGRIDDARISRLDLDLLDGGKLSFDVAAPGYAVAYPEERGPVQAWHFLDPGGRVIHERTAS
jgi:hypothetical protein